MKADWKKNPLIRKQPDREDKDNIFPPCVTDKEFRDIVIEYLLGEDWYVIDPIGREQVNYEALFSILRKHSRRFREEMAARRTDLRRHTEESKAKR